MKKEEIRTLAYDILLELDDREAEDIALEFEKLESLLSFFADIDTEGVKIMAYPFDQATFYMREDEEGNVLSREEALANAGKVNAGHISVPKVLR